MDTTPHLLAKQQIGEAPTFRETSAFIRDGKIMLSDSTNAIPYKYVPVRDGDLIGPFVPGPFSAGALRAAMEFPSMVEWAQHEAAVLHDVTNPVVDPAVADEVIEQNPTEAAGRKYDGGKELWTLMPWDALREVVKVLMYGADKYAPNNWTHVENWRTRYWNAAMRHMLAWQTESPYDNESGHHHLAHAVCCLLFLLAMEFRGAPKAGFPRA